MDIAVYAIAASVLFAASAALVAAGLEIWCRNARRWRLIRDAYTEGFLDGSAAADELRNAEDG